MKKVSVYKVERKFIEKLIALVNRSIDEEGKKAIKIDYSVQ